MSLTPFVPVNNAQDGLVWNEAKFDAFVDSLDQWLEDEVESKTPDKTSSETIEGDWTFEGEVILTSGFRVNRTTSAAGNYVVLDSDYIIAKTGITGGGDTVTLPTVATAGEGRVYIIVDESGTASSNNITINTADAALIDGGASISISQDYSSVTVYCSGTAWFLIAAT